MKKKQLAIRYIVRWRKYPNHILCADGQIRHDNQCGGTSGYKIRYYKTEAGARKYGATRDLAIIVEQREVYV